MSNPTNGQALPVTGSGPFTFAIGIIGAVITAAGWVTTKLARRIGTVE